MISFFCFMLSYFAGSWTLSEIEDNISNMCSEISENCINTKKNIIRQNILNT